MQSRRTGEFQRIARIFAPLAKSYPGALGLVDDAALIETAPGHDLVVTTDTIVAGVHYLGDEPASAISRKLLRVNLSDLAAMGARPSVYTLNIALPVTIDDSWLEDFAAGLNADQAVFGIVLAGGDSVSTPGPVTLTLTAMGTVAHGMALRRDGAAVGDILYVSGTVGDGALGLMAARGALRGLDAAHRERLADRYRIPQPRLELGQALTGLASAALDISDGLIGDLDHIAEASGVCCIVEAGRVPMSEAARTAVAADPALRETILTGGDDYELLFTVPPGKRDMVAAAAAAAGIRITEIGKAEAGHGVRVLDESGRAIAFKRAGYVHC